MEAYHKIVRRILKEGIEKENRTGTNTISISGMIFEHNMADGFPLITTKRVPFGLVASELEFFIKGITDKQWLQDRKNHIWDEWCTPLKVPYANDEETKKKMMEEKDLGPVYGWQWRRFGAPYAEGESGSVKGVDQLAQVVQQIKDNPGSRRLMINAWNPLDLDIMALPPCHYNVQFTVDGDKLNLMWNQRSVDVGLGLPFNIASYALLLHLTAKECGLKEGRLVGFLGDTHIYKNHVEGLNTLLERKPYDLPRIETTDFDSLFTWEYKQSKVKDYKYHPAISFEIAV